MTSTAVVWLLALLPAVVRWVYGRRLVARIDDPALPEHALSFARTSGFVLALAMAFVVLFAPGSVWWALTLMLVMRTAAAYPARRAVLDESWSFVAYLWFFIRLTIGAYGWWIALAVAPALPAQGGVTGGAVAVTTAAILFAWSGRQGDLLGYLLRSRPVDSPALMRRFEALALACGLGRVRFDQVDLHGGVVANAVAVPSSRRPTVLFTDALLDRLEPDEAAAICAHELAHLEHFDRRWLRRRAWLSAALVIVAVLLSPLLQAWAPESLYAARLAWPFVLLVVIAVIGRDRQRHETASDLRAVALSGDADALIRALTKIHAIARVPRRWRADLERQATHPSLARRIQAIRRASGSAPPPLTEARAFVAPDGSGTVTFRPDGLAWTTKHWADTFAYEQLQECRLGVGRRGSRLVIAETDGKTHDMPIKPDDVEALQAILDRLDFRLAAPVMSARTPDAIARLVAGVTAVAALISSQIVVLVLAGVAMFAPVAALLTAAGVASFAAAALVWRDGTSRPITLISGGPDGTVLMLALAGLTLVLVAFLRRGTASPAWASRVPAMLALAALPVWALCLTGASNPIVLNQMARNWPALAILPLAVAVAAFVRGGATARVMAAGAALLGVGAVYVGSTAFLETYGRDSFLLGAADVSSGTIDGSRLGTRTVPFDVSDAYVSPSGRAIALAVEDEQERRLLHVGRLDGMLTPYTADTIRFIDEERALLLHLERDGTALRALRLAEPHTVIWERFVPDVRSAQLTIDRAAGSWSLLGVGPTRAVVRVRGRMDGEVVDRHEWRAEDDQGSAGWPLASVDDQVLVLQSAYRTSWLDDIALLRSARSNLVGRLESRLSIASDRARRVIATSHLDLRCESSPTETGDPVCAAYDGTRTRMLSIDPVTGSVTPLTVLRGRAFLNGHGRSGWVSGWADGPFAIDLAGRRLLRPASPDAERAWQVAVGERVIAIASFEDPGATIRVFELR